MDITLEEIVHVFIKIYGLIVLSKTMSNFSVLWLSPSHEIEQFHKTRRVTSILNKTTPCKIHLFKNTPERQMDKKRNTGIYKKFPYPKITKLFLRCPEQL